MTDDRPTDLLTLKEAATLTGRSERSLRRWRQEGRLRGYAASEPGAPPLVSKAELMTVAVAMAEGAAVAVTQAAKRPRSAVAMAARSAAGGPLPMVAIEGWQRSVIALEREVEDLKTQREDLRGQRDDMRAQRDAARKDLVETRAELADARERCAALERELGGGFVGLLKGTVRRRLKLD